MNQTKPMSQSTSEAFAEFVASCKSPEVPVRKQVQPAPPVKKSAKVAPRKGGIPFGRIAALVGGSLAGIVIISVPLALTFQGGSTATPYEVSDWREKVSSTPVDELERETVAKAAPVEASTPTPTREIIFERLNEARKDATRRITESGMATWSSENDPARLEVVAMLKDQTRSSLNELGDVLSPADREWVIQELNASIEANL